jgi:hypothetical protein
MAKKQNFYYYYSPRFLEFLKYALENSKHKEVIEKLINFHGELMPTGAYRSSLIDFCDDDHTQVSVTACSKLAKMYEQETAEKPMVFERWFSRKVTLKKSYSEERTNLKIGRFIKKMLPDLDDRTVQEVNNHYRAYFTLKDWHMEIVYGEDIVKYYNHDFNYLKTGYGSLQGSCMAYDTRSLNDARRGSYAHVADQLQFYAMNPNVGLLVIKHNKKDLIKGRALIWNLISGEKYIDNWYLDDDADSALYEIFAQNNNCLLEPVNNMEVASTEDIKQLFGTSRGRAARFGTPYLDSMEYNTTRNTIRG